MKMGSSRESIKNSLRELAAISLTAIVSFMLWWLLAQQFTIGVQHEHARHYQYMFGFSVGLISSIFAHGVAIARKRALVYATVLPLLTADLAWSLVLWRAIMLVFASLFSVAGAIAYHWYIERGATP